MWRNNCQDDAIYEILLKHPCTEQFAMYSLDNVPKLKYIGKKVVFNKIVQFDDKSQGDLALASLFVISNSCNIDNVLKYNVSLKEANFAKQSTNRVFQFTLISHRM